MPLERPQCHSERPQCHSNAIGTSPMPFPMPLIKGTTWALNTAKANALSTSEQINVARWQNPPSESIENGNWVMIGNKNFKNYLLSGKFNPLRPKYHVPYNNARIFTVPKSSLKYPGGLEKFKGLPPWNQRRYWE